MRIALISQRNVVQGAGQHVAYGAWSEAEDVLVDAVDVDMVSLDRSIEHPRVKARRAVGRLHRRIWGPQASLPPAPGARPTPVLDGRYDLAIYLAYGTWDLPLLERLGNLRRWADRVVVWFFETWPSDYADGRIAHEPFHVVDDIFVALEAAVEPLSEIIARPVTYLPMATDTLRFGPPTPHQPRHIDLLGLGRRRPESHEHMLRWALERERFYLYDSGPVERPADSRAHRDMIGHWHASARLAICNYGKIGSPELTGDLRIIPGRLWEGLASGAGLIGEPPDPAWQRHLLGREVVEPVPDHPEDLPLFLEEARDRWGPAQAAANVRLALNGHDWAHRWAELFRLLGLAVPEAIELRIDQLRCQATKFDERWLVDGN